MVANKVLNSAKAAKNDEFYTQYSDIEKEVNAYTEYDSDVFRGKVVLLPCDDPEWSNFTRFFAQNFEKLGLKKLISTSYAPNKKFALKELAPTPAERESPQYDPAKTASNGRIFTLTHDVTGNSRIDFDDIQWSYLEGDGDFRSEEVKALRDEADIIVTNPPFSLFREFLPWIMKANKKFLVIGNLNAITYKEMFPLFQSNKIWLGPSITSGDREFRIPDFVVDHEKFTGEVRDGTYYQRVVGVRWFTNLDHGRRHQRLSLMTQADNTRWSEHKQVKKIGYRKYDNYEAIEVPFVNAIPDDYEGVMGVPISFFDKYCPEQFSVLGITENGDNVPVAPYRIPNFEKYDRPYIDGKRIYSRILIQHRSTQE